LLAAARRLAGHRDIAFAFIGGGSECKRIQAEQQKAATRQAETRSANRDVPPIATNPSSPYGTKRAR